MKMHRAKIQNCSEICELEQTTRQCVVNKQDDTAPSVHTLPQMLKVNT